jgi:hypothetical protein
MARRDVAPATAAPIAAVTPTAAGAATAPSAMASTAMASATAAPAGAGRDHARTERCAAVGPGSFEACHWSRCGGGLCRGHAAEQHRPGQRAGAYCTSGGVACGS